MGAEIEQAVILVGGRGTRLGALARDVPKPLVEIAPGVAFLDILLSRLARRGVRHCVLLAGHLGALVEQRYAGASVGEARIAVLREGAPAGTGGALALAAPALAQLFFMLNGDSLFDFDLQALGKTMRAGDVGALALRTIDDPARYGAVNCVDGRIVRFREKQTDLKGPALISAGIYLLRREVLDAIGPAPCSIEADVFPKLAEADRLAGATFDGYFIDIGLPDTLAQARNDLPRLFPDDIAQGGVG